MVNGRAAWLPSMRTYASPFCAAAAPFPQLHQSSRVMAENAALRQSVVDLTQRAQGLDSEYWK